MTTKDIINHCFQQCNINNITYDSRNVQKGDAFFAIKGIHLDGNDYIQDALDKGASLVFTSNPLLKNVDKKIHYVDDAQEALGIAASILYPSKPAHIIAVTGTNGKTSVASYVKQIITKLGKSCASIGTLGIEIDGNVNVQNKINKIYNKELHMTSIDVISFYKILNLLTCNGIDYLVFEASSHGLDQNRIGDIKVQSAAFISFSQDHLDYHKTMEQYLSAKLKLFSKHLNNNGEAVIYSEIDNLNKIKKLCNDASIKIFTVGKNGNIKIDKIEQNITCQNVNFTYHGKKYEFDTNIIGSFQAVNLLIAARLVQNMKFDFDQVIKILPKIYAVSGRLERVTNIDHPYHIFVDYSHTPDALKNTLLELANLKQKNGNLYVIFGCGGERDKSKRAMMGKIATSITDYVVITDDNPRNENPALIRQDILHGAKNTAIEIADRKSAITKTMANLKSNDILLISGKGHEDYQIYGNTKKYFSDVAVVREFLY